jgi:hypothetical protein
VNSKQLNRTAVLVQKAMDKNTPLFISSETSLTHGDSKRF